MYSLLKSLEQLTRFYRRHSPRALRWAKLSYSQCGEDIFLKNLFVGQKQGFYVDVGAFHPYRFSNTCLFHQMGWRGINIEPNPEGYRLFQRHRPRDINLNLAISDTSGTVTFSVQSAMSGIAGDTHRFKDRAAEGRRLIEVRTCPLAEVLERHLPGRTRIDFLTVDCEGHDETVLRSNRWDLYRPRVILVEDHDWQPGTAIDRLLESVRYRFHCRLHVTKVFLEEGEGASLTRP